MPSGVRTLLACVLCLLVVAPAVVGAEASRNPYGHLKPVLVPAEGPDAPAGKQAADTRRQTAGIDVDPEGHTVRIPVRATGSRGVVEWLLTSSGRYPQTACLVTFASARRIAQAFAKAGLASGHPPAPVRADAAHPPKGPALRLTLVTRRADGQTVRIPAETLLGATSAGKPLGPGRWVYVGPRSLADGKVLLSELSGSIATTNLRDASAMIYWVPAQETPGPLYVRAYYGRPKPRLEDAGSFTLEIRPAAAKASAASP